MPSGFTQVVAHGRISFFLTAEQYRIVNVYHISIHSSIDGYTLWVFFVIPLLLIGLSPFLCVYWSFGCLLWSACSSLLLFFWEWTCILGFYPDLVKFYCIWFYDSTINNPRQRRKCNLSLRLYSNCASFESLLSYTAKVVSEIRLTHSLYFSQHIRIKLLAALNSRAKISHLGLS